MEGLGSVLAMTMERYNRNILIKGIGSEGQERLRQAKVLVVGCGGLGSPVLLYLAASGVGTLGLVDYDVVDLSNLQRQILHFTPDIGRLKTDSAGEKLHALNPELTLCIHNEKLTPDNAFEWVMGYDFVVDCSDNYATKFLINDVCVTLGKAYSHGSVVAMQGQAMTYTPGNACYRCAFHAPPQEEDGITSRQAGILGAMAGIIGSIQATETIKYLTGMGGLLTNSLLLADGGTMTFRTLKLSKDETCSCNNTFLLQNDR